MTPLLSATEKDIKYVEVLGDKVYVEFTDSDSAYVSFSKAKNIIKDSKTKQIPYTCCDSQKAIDFINTIPFKKTVYIDNKSYLVQKEKTNVAR